MVTAGIELHQKAPGFFAAAWAGEEESGVYDCSISRCSCRRDGCGGRGDPRWPEATCRWWAEFVCHGLLGAVSPGV